MKTTKIYAVLAGALTAFSVAGSAHAALAVNAINTTTITANSMAQSLLEGGGGIAINSVTYTGVNDASGLFSGGTGIVGFESGIILTSGSAAGAVGPNSSGGFTVNTTAGGDSLLQTVTGITGTEDASRLDIVFTPTGNNVEFSYVFASEEYNEFVNSSFNDVFAFIIGGVNYARIGSPSVPVSINNVNCGNPFSGTGPNCASFRNNAGGSIDTQYDGLTTVLTFVAPVNAGVQNTLSLIIADVADGRLDSAVFIAGGSFSTCGGPGQDPCGNGGGGGNGQVPEPGSLGLLAAAALAFAGIGRRYKRKQAK